LKINILYILLFLTITTSYSQISPGDLTKAHAKYEGMSNCTLCHEIGKKVTNAKCLDCHKDIQSLINKKQGYHVNNDVKSKDCFECHSEHHGRKFDMVRFDQDNFNHNKTGYKLEGKHDVVDCNKCHDSKNISNTELKKRKNTFLGLEKKCLSCHTDYHQETLSTNKCLDCHDMETFEEATNFNHDETDYVLTGKHTTIECKECHKETVKNGKEFQQFNNIAFNDCKSCHSDPHKKQLNGKCKQCHTEKSFSFFTGRKNFNHNKTNFKLKGAHRKTNCFTCHEKTNKPLAIFQDKKNFKEKNCIACHDDKHENKYGNECAKCHKEDSFLDLNDMSFFDHNVTDYHLNGMHTKVNCKECHKKRFSDTIDFSACYNCHNDYHNGEFIIENKSPDCNACHTIENPFNYSTYSIEQHQKTNFTLEGAHIATPCFACHVSEKKWSFKNIGSACIDCHQDLHEDFIDEKYYPNKDCKNCHNNEAWSTINFDHNFTDWELKGKHINTNCRECHFENSKKNSNFVQIFNTLDTKCVTCHDNIHNKQFEINGITNCERCHTEESWFPQNFNHNKTNFPLEGKHAKIACNECHNRENNSDKIIYKIEKYQCVDCHK
jgi:hypothetical protein